MEKTAWHNPLLGARVFDVAAFFRIIVPSGRKNEQVPLAGTDALSNG